MTIMGTLKPEALVLAAIAGKDGYAYQLSQRMKVFADGIEPVLYMVLKKLKAEGLVVSYIVNEDGRPRKYYTATLMGQTRNELNKAQWITYQNSVSEVLGSRDSSDEL